LSLLNITLHVSDDLSVQGVQNCTHSIRYISYRLVVCMPKQSNNLYDIYLILCVQSWTPDDGRQDRPKHVDWYSINSKIVHLVGFIIEIYHDARSYERQIGVSWLFLSEAFKKNYIRSLRSGQRICIDALNKGTLS
jgi:hypothetical protein